MSVLVCESPAHLTKVLSAACANKSLKAQRIHLLLFDTDILLSPFEFPLDQQANLSHKLLLDAADFLSLPTSDIDVQHTLWSNHGSLKGVYAAMAHQRAEEYFHIALKQGLRLKGIWPLPLVLVALFAKNQTGVNKQNVFLHVYDEHSAVLSVLSNQQGVILRTVKFESFQELKHEITTTMQSGCANSMIKEWDKLYISGDLSAKETLLNDLRKKFNDRVVVLTPQKIGDAELAVVKDRIVNFMDALVPSPRAQNLIQIVCGWGFMMALAANILMLVLSYQKSLEIHQNTQVLTDLKKR